MSDYLAFVHGGIEQAGQGRAGAVQDGESLAEQCLDQLEQLDAARFPPRLLILLASPTYIGQQRAQALVDGIHRTFSDRGHRDIKLIGSSVAAVFFRQKVYPEGALLVCIASRLFEVSVASATMEDNPAEAAVSHVLEKLKLNSDHDDDPNPFANRSLLTFLPNNRSEGYLAAQVYNAFRKRLWARVPIMGGVSSGFDGNKFRPGVQFAGRTVNRDLVVAACITTQTLLGMSVTDRLQRTEDTISITKLDGDLRTVAEFDAKPATEVIRKLEAEHKFVFLGRRSFGGEPLIEMPQPVGGTTSVKLFREANVTDTFRVLKLDLSASARDSIERSCKSIDLSKPAGCLGLRCSGYFAGAAKTGIDLAQEIIEVEQLMRLKNGYVGGFVDGEIGRDIRGRSQIRSWSTATVIFGDELLNRTSFRRAFVQLAKFLAEYPTRFGPEETSIEALLGMISHIGFPGCRLWLAVEDNTGRVLVTPNQNYALGSLSVAPKKLPLRLRVDPTARDAEERAAIVERQNESIFFHWKPGAASSYFVVPLKTIRHSIMAVLEIDLGKKQKLRTVEEELLTHLGTIVGASLTRIFSWQETTIRIGLQNAVKEAISASRTSEGLDRYLTGITRALGLHMIHIREADRKRGELCLYGGLGKYYDAAYKSRPVIGFSDVSHTASTFARQGEGSSTIINDAQNDPSHLKMIEQAANLESKDLGRVLKRIGSYANVRFESRRGDPMEGERVIEGTINLLSEEPWFFKYPQRKVLGTISDQLGFVINHLEQKDAQRTARIKAENASQVATEARKREEEVNRRLEFLLKVTPQLADQKLTDFEGTLTALLDRFCQNVGATVGSIYLWDVDRNLYVLRAQHGWKEPSWVNTATYSKEASWFAARELRGEPRHLPDLFGYYEDMRYARRGRESMPGGLYAPQMFGEKLSPTSNVEVLGLPLKIGSREIGVLAMYRPIVNGEPSGFVPTVIDMVRTSDRRAVLLDAASNVSGLIEALLQHQDDDTDNHEQERRKKLSDVISDHIERESDASFSSLICHSVGSSYAASRVALYHLTWDESTRKVDLKLEDSYTKSPVSVEKESMDSFLQAAVNESIAIDRERRKQGQSRSLAPVTAEELQKIPSGIRIHRKPLEPHDPNDQTTTTVAGLVDRVCLPIFRGPQSIWLVDMHWQVNQPRTYAKEARLREKHLRQMSDDLSKFARLWAQTLRRIEAERTQRGLLGKVGVVAQLAHTWRDKIPELQSTAYEAIPAERRLEPILFNRLLDLNAQQLPDDWRAVIADLQERAKSALRNHNEREDHIKELFKKLVAMNKENQELLELARRELRPHPIGLYQLLAMREDGTRIYSQRYPERFIPLEHNLREDLEVYVTPITMTLAFGNIVDNAILHAEVSNPKLTINVSQEGELVHVRFSNNGHPIEPRIRDAVNNDRYDQLGGSWGLVIAKSFAQHDEGNLRVEDPDEGAELKFILRGFTEDGRS